MRLVELQIESGAVVAPKPVEFVCGDTRKSFTAVFYNDLEPNAAVLTFAGDQSIAIIQRAASGAHYSNDGVDFWEHQGEAKVAWYGTQMTCKVAS
ncbi:Membrane-bound lysozyme-inhibitor of c-type lysozyme [compost metagenome]